MMVAGTPLELARAALERGQRPGLGLEVYAQFGRTLSIKVLVARWSLWRRPNREGLGCGRSWTKGADYAYTGDLSAAGIDGVVAEQWQTLAPPTRILMSGFPGRRRMPRCRGCGRKAFRGQPWPIR